MSKFPFIVASVALGSVLVAGSAQIVTAESNFGPQETWCYYSGTICSYYGPGYWSGCDPDTAPGVMGTNAARRNCTTFHPED